MTSMLPFVFAGQGWDISPPDLMHTSLFGGVERSHCDSPSLTPSQCVWVGGRNTLLPNKFVSPGTPHYLHRHQDGEEAHYCLVGMKIPVSYFASPDTTPSRDLGSLVTPRRVEV